MNNVYEYDAFNMKTLYKTKNQPTVDNIDYTAIDQLVGV